MVFSSEKIICLWNHMRKGLQFWLCQAMVQKSVISNFRFKVLASNCMDVDKKS